mgnify:CR=1 FL=1
MKAKLNVLIALSHHASFLILDEPTNGLDVLAREEIIDLIREFMEEDENRSVLISSHISSDLEGLCDDIYMIDDGKFIFHETTDCLLDQYGLLKLTEEQFIENVNNINIAIMGQSGNLVPADKKLYALRDVTATVDNMSLIASSIMSKKIASGADAIVLDVKVGDGAFMKTPETAKELAREMVDIGNHLGRKTIGVISDMDQPLGFAIGNSLEIMEAIELLKGNGPKDLLELTLTLGSNMLICAKKAETEEQARKRLEENIANGKGLEKLKEFIKAQGGDISAIDDFSKFPKAKYIEEVVAPRDGYITKIKAEAFGLIAMELGAGRATKESEIDLAVGLVLNKKRSDKVNKGDVLAYIHSNNKNK